MKIAVNARFLLPGKLEGIGWYTFHIVKRMVESHPEDQFYLLFDRPPSGDLKFPENTRILVLPPPARHPVLWYLWMEVSVSRFLKKEKPDVFFSPDGFLNLKTSIPQVPVIHDINFIHHPEFLKRSVRNYYQKYFPQFVKKADQIITVSEYSKKDISETFRVSPSRITVTYNSSQRKFLPISEEVRESERARWTDGDPYFLFVGAFNPRKNLRRLFKAFDRFADENSTFKLVLVGERMYWSKEIEETFVAMTHSDRVVFTGRLEGEELNRVYSAAYALVFPSINEGFGIPIVEAYQAGIPVITSNTTSLPEVAGKGAVLVDPLDVSSISEAMMKLAKDPDERDRLAKLGSAEQERFDWDRSAEIAYGVLQNVVRSHG